MRSFHWQLCLLACFSFTLTTGCQETAPETAQVEEDHQHEHAHAETLAEAVTELNELHSEIAKAFTADKPDDAHDALHDVGHVLEELAPLAKNEKLPDDRMAAIETAVTTLMDGYGELDKTMHGAEGKSWSEVSASIDEALKSIKAAVSGEAAPSAEPTAGTEEKPADEKPADEKPADEKPADEKTAEGKPADAVPADEAPKAE
jgi:hypothetical protein